MNPNVLGKPVASFSFDTKVSSSSWEQLDESGATTFPLSLQQKGTIPTCDFAAAVVAEIARRGLLARVGSDNDKTQTQTIDAKSALSKAAISTKTECLSQLSIDSGGGATKSSVVLKLESIENRSEFDALVDRYETGASATTTTTTTTTLGRASPYEGPVRFIEYAPNMFSFIRSHCFPEESNVLMAALSATPTSSSWTVHTTEGKSASRFYFFGDFVLKSIRDEEWKYLKKKGYLRALGTHFIEGHGTPSAKCLLPHILSIFRIKWNVDDISCRFMLCNNAVRSTLPVSLRYDLKGSSVGRSAEGGAAFGDGSVSHQLPLLKDNDLPSDEPLLRQHLLGETEQKEFLECVHVDTTFLEQNKIVDYSLYVAFLRGTDSIDHVQYSIIDILQPYNTRKHFETGFKSLFFDRSGISVVPPRDFKIRFNEMAASLVYGKQKETDTNDNE
eukprot:PhM_4_TR1327/c5_g1_i2/m.101126/K00920/PIP4K2; 1-phosphatidylinositol-5-phosphate 4-kinase